MLIIAGEGPALRALKARSASRGLTGSVLFVGYLDRETALLDCYRSADALVFASRTETQGLVLLEAMAVGTPVISTAVLGTKDVLERDSEPGALIVREDRGDFAAAIVRVLEDRDLKRELGERGHRYVAEHWSSGAMARRLLDLYMTVSSRDSATVARPRRAGGLPDARSG